ncbi:MAG: hypothetical protein LBC64_03625 [Fibromonadaceae bacterium]|nr:hypothetical protein [Fibromonadaceae bacterium]
MISFSARILPLLVVLFAFLFTCSRESTEPLWGTQSHLGSTTYNGGLFPVWITLKEPVSDINSIRWKTGSSTVAYRTQSKQVIDANRQLIYADTAFLHWDILPAPYNVIIDSSKGTKDSIFFYRDTVFAIVNGLQSLPIVIEIKNILPRIKKFTVGGLEQFGDSTLTVAVHPSDHMEISIQLEKLLNKNRPIVTMPKEMKELGGQLTLDESKSNDTLWVYKWKGPQDTTNKTLTLKIEDSGGYGERLYKVRMIVYTEPGSVWIASENELLKFSSMGTEVARLNNGFKYISDIVVNSKDGRLFVADQEKNFIRIYNTYGKLLSEDSSFASPTGIAVGVEGASAWVWVADSKDKTTEVPQARLRRFEFSGSDSSAKLGPGIINYEMPGAVKGLSVDQYNRDFVWFVITEGDTVGFTRAASTVKTEPKYVLLSNDTAWQRPTTVSYRNGLAWVADSGRVVAVDSSKKIKAIIKGFSSIPSISACGNGIWASDVETGKVYRFKGPFRGEPSHLRYTIVNGEESSEKFSVPVSVSALTTDCSVWVVDKGYNKVVLLDSLGNFKASGTGITSPILGKTLQKWE